MSKKVVLTKDEVKKLVDQASEVIGLTAKASRPIIQAENANVVAEATNSTCISVTVEDGEACFEIPIIDKDICVKVPSWIPEGTVAKACVSVQLFPPKACLTVTALGTRIFKKCFGL